MEILGRLKPAFKQGGSTTAGLNGFSYFPLLLAHLSRQAHKVSL